MARSPWQYVRPATMEDALFIAPRMRQADKDEIWASHHSDPFESLVRGLSLSDRVFTVHYGEPTYMFGVVPKSVITGEGVVWALGTDNLTKNTANFLRHSSYFMGLLLDGYDRLVNHVDVRHKHAVRWLKWLGAAFAPAAPYGLEGLPFHYFEVTHV